LWKALVGILSGVSKYRSQFKTYASANPHPSKQKALFKINPEQG
jgi:hypothetical protein